jgi:hypothetical protein
MVHKPEKFKQEEGKKKLKSNFIHQSFLNESFGAFVDFASSIGNQTTTLSFELTGVPSLEKKSAARPGPGQGSKAQQQPILGFFF